MFINKHNVVLTSNFIRSDGCPNNFYERLANDEAGDIVRNLSDSQSNKC